MNSHIEYSKELNFFAYKFITLSCDDFLISQESQKRVTISKMYYALYHRILEELPILQTSKGSNKHEAIEKILEKQCNKGSFYTKLFELFRDLKSLRVWADYEALNSIPNELNLNLLQRKLYSNINAKKLIY